MDKFDKELFIKDTSETLEHLYDDIFNSESVDFFNLDCKKTVMAMVDIINGFIYEGVLSDRSIEGIIPPVSELMKHCNEKDIDVLAFADCHLENAAEFSAFPRHCIKGESESEVVNEIKKAGRYTLIGKNSTNGFHTSEFKNYIELHSEKTTFVVCGDCTDICVLNFCLSLKTWFNINNIKSEVIVPINMIDTYNSASHEKNFMNVAALKIMKDCGIKIVKEVRYNG